MVAAVEGAIVLSRARRDPQPLLDVSRELETTLREPCRSEASSDRVALRREHSSSLLPWTTFPPPVGFGEFSLRWRLPSTVLLAILTPPVFWNAWMFPPTR